MYFGKEKPNAKVSNCGQTSLEAEDWAANDVGIVTTLRHYSRFKQDNIKC